MGRYDKLTQLEEPKTPTPSVVSPPSKVTQPANVVSQTHEVKKNSKLATAVTQPHDSEKSTNPQNRLSTIQSPTRSGAEKVEKYTTHLEPSLVKKVKHYAVEKDIKDYEVIKNALLLYFDQNK
jgi:hypothetical protein